MSDTPKITPATIADLLAIPDEDRNHEVINGVLVEKEATSGRHGGAHSVNRWHADGYVEVLIAARGERVRADPFGAIELPIGVLFGGDPDE